MRCQRNGLAPGILKLFASACADGRWAVAEHLLRALEEIDRADEVPVLGFTEQTELAEAYALLAKMPPHGRAQ